MKLLTIKDFLLLIDEEAEIKAGSYYTTNLGNIYKETERPFEEDEGVERFTNRNLYTSVIAYRKLNSESKELDLPELPPFEVNIEKLACEKYQYTSANPPYSTIKPRDKISGFIEGYKAAQSKQFSLEDMYRVAIKTANKVARAEYGEIININEIVDTYIQSLSTQQIPKEFIPEYEDRVALDGHTIVGKELKTITNSEGKQELVGIYKY